MLKRPERHLSLIALIFSVAIVVTLFVAAFSHQLVSAASQLFASVNSGAIFSVNLSHEQEVWLAALEWCESRGIPEAINPKDRDGTPSYYSFQFKPATFKIYGIRYGLFSRDISDEEVKNKLSNYQLQKKMVSLMFDDPRVVWKKEFPDCVRRLGLPPAGK